MLDNPFLSSIDYFLAITFFIFLRKHQSQTISNQFNRSSVGPDLGPIALQR